MNIHEYQAKALLASYGLPVPQGMVAVSAAEAVSRAQSLGGDTWVVKAQIHAGGRGKGGGVKLARSIAEVESYSQAILGMNLITPQTGPEGQKVHKVYIAKACDIKKELYLSLLVDRSLNCLTFIASKSGGMDIEEVAEKTPEEILKASVETDQQLAAEDISAISMAFGLTEKQSEQLLQIMQGIKQLFIEKDADLIEINPLIIDENDNLQLLDAKISFDDNALMRHSDIAELRDETEEDPAERQANAAGLSYIKLDGSVGCMVNGAGLAMATMDIIKIHGGNPANFLDVGGSATRELVTLAFKIITSDANVKAILVNIFGGIMRCDIIAEGIIHAVKEVGLSLPLIVRLAGTNVKEGRRILEESGLKITFAQGLTQGAQQAVLAAK